MLADEVPFRAILPTRVRLQPGESVLGAASVEETARRLNLTPAQVALAWLLHLASNILLIPGTADILGIMSLRCVVQNMWLTVEALGIGMQIMSVFSAHNGRRSEDTMVLTSILSKSGEGRTVRGTR